MNKLITILLVLFCSTLFAQKTAIDFGYQHIELPYKNEIVDIVIESKVDESNQKKPILLLIQGSECKPLIVYADNGKHLPPFFFDEHIFLDSFHLVMISKPAIPVAVNQKVLSKKGRYVDPKTKKVPKEYTEKNNLPYYVERNSFIIDFLATQAWVDTTKVIVAGHSEGSSIATKLAVMNTKVTHLIYSGGNAYFPRIMAMIAQDRKSETKENSWVEKDFAYWKKTVRNPFDTSRDHGWNSYKGSYTFSKSENIYLKRLKIPILITYGTKDESSIFNDMFRVETIYENIKNITFKAYIGVEHNYFGVTEEGQIDYQQYGWDKVGKDWKVWMMTH